MSRVTAAFEAQLKLDGASLGRNQSTRYHCPVCMDNKAKSFVLWRDENGLHYKCYRVSCGAYGLLTRDGSYAPQEAKQKLTPYQFVLTSLPLNILKLLRDRYEIDLHTTRTEGLRWNVDYSTLAIPIHNYYNQLVGYIDRDFSGTRQTKAKTYWTKESEDRLDWNTWKVNENGTILLVEDCLSRIKASDYTPTVALLGTGLNEKQVLSLRSKVEHVYMCLDDDAQAKALKYKEKYSCMFRSWTNIRLPKDIKDTPRSELVDTFRSYNLI